MVSYFSSSFLCFILSFQKDDQVKASSNLTSANNARSIQSHSTKNKFPKKYWRFYSFDKNVFLCVCIKFNYILKLQTICCTFSLQYCWPQHRRVNGTIFGGVCTPCTCFGHAESCDNITGECLVSYLHIESLMDLSNINSICKCNWLNHLWDLKYLSRKKQKRSLCWTVAEVKIKSPHTKIW